MPNGKSSTMNFGGSTLPAITSAVVDGFRNVPSVDDKGDSDPDGRMPEKDPRKIARKFQLELCNKALEENIIVYLGTGCGKTHIAVLLIHAMGHLIRKPQRNICVFLAPTVALVQQQAGVIENSTNFKTGVYCGNSKRLKSLHDWEEEIKKYEVLVMTPQILLRNLHHCFIKMEFIALLIFDECHHAQVNSNHPYSQIMKVFYVTNVTKLPRVFGMTASPVIGKVASDEGSLSKSINSLESLLDAKVYTVEDRDDLEAFVSSPLVKVYHYGPVENNLSSSFMTCCHKLEDIKRQCISMLGGEAAAHQTLLSTKKLLCRVHDNIKLCIGSLGLWGALQASQILLSGDRSEWSELIEAEENQNDVTLCDKYLAQAAQLFASECGRDLSCVDIFKEPFFSKKLLRLVGILTTFRFRPNMKCIIFVNRIVIARSLSFILQNLKSLVYWKCHFLIGVHAGVKSMSRKTMNAIIEKFRSGELNLLVATRVGEEGLDIQTCCLVIRFDMPETVASFIQSRGRARMPESEYAFLVDSGNQRELDLIKNFRVDEDRIDKEVSSRTSSETFTGSEESIYKVESSGSLITSGYSVSLLHQYCSKLPHDEYFEPKPKFFFFDDLGGTVCHIILPSNAPMHQVSSTPQSSKEAAKKDACLKAIQELHKLGAVNDFLLPITDDANAEELDLASADPDSCEDDDFGFISNQRCDSREEIYEMIVPGALKDAWTDSNNVSLNVYLIKLSPDPNDRIYKEFGLFVKTPLPKEAEAMEVDLHLSRGRSVMVKLKTLGPVKLNKDEIKLAEKFQEMFLKIILDRSEFVHQFVPFGQKSASESSSSTFYLLLPMIFSEKSCSELIDWEIIRRCLSSPVFSDRMDSWNRERLPSRTQLQLADGCRSISDVKNSLVYAPHKKVFYFIADIDYGKNGYSPYTNSGPTIYVEHLIQKFGIYLKYPGQPLLRAKQLFHCRNLLHNRNPENFEAQHLEEHFIDLPPELCELKIIGFSKEVGSSLSLLPSIMHRLENLLVAVELKHLLSGSFPEGAKVTVNRILEALTTEKCQERFSLERLEILGDAFLKFAVGRHLFLLHDALGEGELTKKRSDIVKNSNLLKLATSRNLQVYIRDQSFEPSQFYALGRPSPFVCDKKTMEALHNKGSRSTAVQGNLSDVNCSKRHHWLQNGTISDVVEALVGAFLVDSGFKAAIAFLRWIGIQMKFESLKVHKIWSDSKSYIPLSDSVDIASLEKSLDYKFNYRGLVLQAFVHPSYNKHGGGCYQRLEFLGDAVLDYLITSYLYSAYPKLKPGQLTDLRSVFVSNEAFASVAVHWSFHNFLICDSNNLRDTVKSYVESIETPAGGTVPLGGPKYPKVLGDLVESCVGAILLDTGFDLNLVWKTMLSFLEQLTRLSSFQLSPLREIGELCQSFGWTCDFKASKKEKMFFVSVEVKGDKVKATGSASNENKKKATNIALQSILSQLRPQGYISEATKFLEEALKSSCKMEAKLIGYDEIPMAVTAPETVPATVGGPLDINSEPKIQLFRERCSPPSQKTPVNRQPSSDNGASNSCKTTARSLLYEVCAAQHWTPPLFDCLKEEGLSHLRSFIFRAVVQMDETPDTTLEAFGGSHLSKKAAAEHAAEGMLWYLRNSGHLPDPPASL